MSVRSVTKYNSYSGCPGPDIEADQINEYVKEQISKDEQTAG